MCMSINNAFLAWCPHNGHFSMFLLLLLLVCLRLRCLSFKICLGSSRGRALAFTFDDTGIANVPPERGSCCYYAPTNHLRAATGDGTEQRRTKEQRKKRSNNKTLRKLCIPKKST